MADLICNILSWLKSMILLNKSYDQLNIDFNQDNILQIKSAIFNFEELYDINMRIIIGLKRKFYIGFRGNPILGLNYQVRINSKSGLNYWV